jgi:hypothetical protein
MKYMIRYLFCLSLFGCVANGQAQKIMKSNTINDDLNIQTTHDDSLVLLNSRERIANINSTLKESRKGRAGGLLFISGVIGFTSYDLITNSHNISKVRKTLDWVGFSFCTAGLMGFFIELGENRTLKRDRKWLEELRSEERV